VTDAIQPLTLDAWDARYTRLKAAGLDEPPYGGPLSRHLCDGDTRLAHLRFDSSAAALDLWNFLLTEEMLALHFCSDRAESLRVLEGLLREVRRRVSGGVGMAGGDRVRVFWVNPVADLRAMNLLGAAFRGAGPHGAGRSHGRTDRRARGQNLPGCKPFRGRGGDRVPHSGRQSLRVGSRCRLR